MHILWYTNDINYQLNFLIEGENMDKILISEDAYKEFKAFLDENEVDNYSIRINLAGFGCSGPAFNITVDDAQEGDIVEKVNDITFVVE